MEEEIYLNKIDEFLKQQALKLESLQTAMSLRQKSLENLVSKFTSLNDHVQQLFHDSDSSSLRTTSPAITIGTLAPLLARPLRFDFSRFNGSDVLGWINQAEHFFNYYGVDDSQRLSIASVHMDGVALQWFQSLDHNIQLTSWVVFTRALKVRFVPIEFETPHESLVTITQADHLPFVQSEFELANKTTDLPSYSLTCCSMLGMKSAIRTNKKHLVFQVFDKMTDRSLALFDELLDQNFALSVEEVMTEGWDKAYVTKETITYLAQLCLPSSLTKLEVQEPIDNTIIELGLRECGDFLICNWHLRGISGDEKYRLSNALKNVTKPPRPLLLYEPTSVLDSSSDFFVVVQGLQNVACHGGGTIVSSIHQPNSEFFALLADTSLLFGGEIEWDPGIDYFFPQIQLVLLLTNQSVTTMIFDCSEVERGYHFTSDGFEVEVETSERVWRKTNMSFWLCCTPRDCKLRTIENRHNFCLGEVLHSNKGCLFGWPSMHMVSLIVGKKFFLHHACVFLFLFSNQVDTHWVAFLYQEPAEVLKWDAYNPFVYLTNQILLDAHFGMFMLLYHSKSSQDDKFFTSSSYDQEKNQISFGICAFNSYVGCNLLKEENDKLTNGKKLFSLGHLYKFLGGWSAVYARYQTQFDHILFRFHSILNKIIVQCIIIWDPGIDRCFRTLRTRFFGGVGNVMNQPNTSSSPTHQPSKPKAFC